MITVLIVGFTLQILGLIVAITLLIKVFIGFRKVTK